jgi:hypothetical protein
MIWTLSQGGVLAATVVEACSGTGEHKRRSSRAPFIPVNQGAEELHDDLEETQDAFDLDGSAGIGWDLSLQPAGLTQGGNRLEDMPH